MLRAGLLTPFVLSEVEGRAASGSSEARASTSLSTNGGSAAQINVIMRFF
jgi:hypothetical protein